MRVAFTGKGGSGKTTISSLFALQAVRDGHNVLALDADINQHLSNSLGLDTKLMSMGEHLDDIKQYLQSSVDIHKTTPPQRDSQFVQMKDDDWFMRTFTQQSHGVNIAGAGDIPEGNVGIKCYHGLNGAVELVLGHMIDRPDDIVVVDMTAGADAFSSSLFTKVDALVLVVEPTLKSLAVYDQFKPHAREYGIPLLVVGNKIESAADRELIESRVGAVTVYMPVSSYVKRCERGQSSVKDMPEQDMVLKLCLLRKELLKIERNWKLLERRSHEMHRKNAASQGFEVRIDKGFSLEETAQRVLNE
jgi:CO dehydrogenase maturation factor